MLRPRPELTLPVLVLRGQPTFPRGMAAKLSLMWPSTSFHLPTTVRMPRSLSLSGATFLCAFAQSVVGVVQGRGLAWYYPTPGFPGLMFGGSFRSTLMIGSRASSITTSSTSTVSVRLSIASGPLTRRGGRLCGLNNFGAVAIRLACASRAGLGCSTLGGGEHGANQPASSRVAPGPGVSIGATREPAATTGAAPTREVAHGLCGDKDGDHSTLLQSPRAKLRNHEHDTFLDLSSSNMFTTVPLPPWPVLSDSHDEQHVVKDRPSLYTTRHFDAVVLAKALGPHSHEVAFSTLWNGRCRGGGGSAGHEGGTGGGGGDSGDGDRNLHRGGGHGDGLKGGRGRGAAGTTQGGAAGAAADN